MASLLFPDTGTRMVLLASGRPAVNKVGALYADADGTDLAEVYADVDGVKGALITSGEVTTDAYGQLPSFWGPADGTDRLYITVNGGPLVPVDADYNARIDAAASATSTVQAYAVQRANHTGAQAIATVTGLQSALDGKVTKGELVVNIADAPYNADRTGATDSTAAIQAAIDAAGYGGRVLIPVGTFKYTSLTLNHSQKLIGVGWHHLRDATTTFGDSAWATTGFFGGSVLRCTATSGASIVHVGSGGNNVMEGGLEDLILIGPGTGTAVGVQVGTSSVPVVKPVYRNVAVGNFATGTALTNVNEGSFYDLTTRGCTKGVSLAQGVNANTFVGLNMQRCSDGLVFEDTTSLANTFVAPICQNVTGTGMVIRGESMVVTTPYFENVPTVMQFDGALLCQVLNPSVQGAGIKNLDITNTSSDNEFHGLKTNVAAFTVSNAGYASLFTGILVGITDTGQNTFLIDQNNAILSAPKLATSSAGNPSVVYGAAQIGARFGASGPEDRKSSGAPEGSATAPVGSNYRRTDGGPGTTMYLKESGTGNTGWAAVQTANGLRVKEGSNAKQGTATLVAGTVTVANTSVTATSRILLTVQSLGTVTAPKTVAVTARTAGTSFTITSADATDTSVVAYQIFEVA